MEMLCYKNTILRGVGGNMVSVFTSLWRKCTSGIIPCGGGALRSNGS